MIDFLLHPLLTVLIGYGTHVILGFAFDLRGVALSRAVFPIASLKLWKRFVRHATFHTLRAVDDAQDIVVRTSLVEKTEGYGTKTLRYYTHTAELIALQEIAAHLSEHNVALNTKHFYSNAVSEDHVLLLGSDANTRLSKNMLARLGENVEWTPSKPPNDDHPSFKMHEHAYGCTDIDGKVAIDYGLIIRRTTPNGGVTLLCAGIHAYGTYGAVQVALRKDFQRFVKSRTAPSFAQLIRVEVTEGKDIANAGITWREQDFAIVNAITP